MDGDLPRGSNSLGHIVIVRLAAVAAIAAAALVGACSQQSDQQQAQQQQQQAAADEQARKEADEKAWGEAEHTGTVAAYNTYLQNFSAGAHVSEALQRVAALNEQARKQADDKAWADAASAGHWTKAGPALRQLRQLIESLQSFDHASHRPKGIVLLEVLRGRSAATATGRARSRSTGRSTARFPGAPPSAAAPRRSRSGRAPCRRR